MRIKYCLKVIAEEAQFFYRSEWDEILVRMHNLWCSSLIWKMKQAPVTILVLTNYLYLKIYVNEKETKRIFEWETHPENGLCAIPIPIPSFMCKVQPLLHIEAPPG